MTIRVTDPSGNFTDCISKITVVDNIAPVITCAPPATYQKNATCVTIMPNLIGVGGTTATDATSTCSPVVITQFTSGRFNHCSRRSKSWTSKCSNRCKRKLFNLYNYNVQFRDQTPPVISDCPANITVTTGVGNTDCQMAVNWTPPTATDNCSPILGTTTLTSTHLPGQQFFVGTTPVTYTATDAAGNTSLVHLL